MSDESKNETSEPKSALGLISWLILLACAAVPPAFATAFTRFEDLKMAIFGILLGAAMVTFGVAVIRGKTITITAGRIVAAALVFALYAAASILWAPQATWGAVHATTWLGGVAAFLGVLGPVGRPMTFSDFAVATSVGTLICGAFGILDLAGLELFTPVWNPVGPTASFDAAEFVQPFYAVALPIVVAGAWRLRGPQRIVAGIALALGAFHFGLCATWLPLGVFTATAAIVTLIVLALQRFARFPLLLPIMALFFIGMVIAAIPNVAIEPTEDDTYATALPRVVPKRDALPGAELRDTNFASGRWESITSTKGLDYALGQGFSLFREQPVFGQGPGGWWLAQTRYPDAGHPWVEGRFDHYPALRSPHNSLMLLLVELGGAGLLLFLLWFAAVVGVTFTALSTTEESENWLIEHWALATSCSVGFVFCFFTPAFELAASAVIWFVAFGLLARESAMLNGLKGLSAPITVNRDGRRYDVVIPLGVFPVAVGLLMVVVSGFGVASNYYRGLDDHLMLAGKYERVGENYSKAEEIWGGRGELHYNRALALKRGKSLKSAADHLNKAADLRPDDARIVNLVAYLNLQSKELDEAVKDARRAQGLFPNYIDAYRAEALAHDLGNAPEKAVEVVEDALKLEPPAIERGRLHQEAGNYYMGPLKQPGKAAEHFQKALSFATTDLFRQEVEKELERAQALAEAERLMREGKVVPEDVKRRAAPPEPHMPFGGGHDHGPGGHEGHDH